MSEYRTEYLVRELFPNIPGPEYTRQLKLESDAIHYIKLYGNDVVKCLEDKCKYCPIDDCPCSYPEIITHVKRILNQP